jgi:hypothetical protein
MHILAYIFYTHDLSCIFFVFSSSFLVHKCKHEPMATKSAMFTGNTVIILAMTNSQYEYKKNKPMRVLYLKIRKSHVQVFFFKSDQTWT